MTEAAVAPPGTAGANELKREFTLWSSFAFAFAFISPIVALYGIFGLAVTTAGPSFWWGFLVVFGGQMLVALVFAMLVSKWPYEGSVYQWARQLLGRNVGWFAGWTYLWTLIIAMATVALGAAGFIANVAGIDNPSGATRAWIALAILLAGTAVNIAGRLVLRVFMTASICAEVIGSLGLGTWLLIFHHHNSLSALLDGAAATQSHASYLSISGPFVAAIAFIGFSFVGFESAGSIAEEVYEPRKNLPKAVLMALVFIAAVVMYSSLAIILAIPDLHAVGTGQVVDPVYSTLTSQLGSGIARPVELLFVIGFVASFLALQTSASRIIWSTSRDGALPGAKVLARLSRKQRQPVAALLVTTAIGAVLLLMSNVASAVYAAMVNFTSGSFFLAFLFPLVGALVVQLRGRWVVGQFDLGRFRLPLTLIAVLWAVAEFVNIAWPRQAYAQTYLNWSVWIGTGVLAVLGAVVFAAVRRNLRDVDRTESLGLDELEPANVA
jgi:amino acid transporter